MLRQALVLAAGLGRRMGGVKQLARIRGRPLLWYPLSVLHAVGVAEVCLVVRRETAADLAFLASSIYGGSAVHIVINDRPELENGYSLLLGLRLCPLDAWGHVFVSMSDHVYSPLIASRVSESQHAAYIIAADRSPAYVDVGEATRLLSDGLYGYRVGKKLEPWSHVDCGLHSLVPGLVAPAAERLLAETRVLKLNNVTDYLARSGMLGVAQHSGLPWMDVDTPEELRDAEAGRRSGVVDHVLEWLHS